MDNPPVNALGHALRSGIMQALTEALADPAVKAIVFIGATGRFSAGADIREFGKPRENPVLNEVISAIESAGKLTVAAIDGVALGGGMELSLGCDYRMVLQGARMSLPEVTLGILPGGGGTQRLPRLIGAEKALDFIVSGRMAGADELLSLGIADRVVEGDLRSQAIEFAESLIRNDAPARPIRAMVEKDADEEVFTKFEQSIARKQRGFLAPFACIKAVRASVEKDFDAGMAYERELFTELVNSPESRAQRHVFFAEREAAKVPNIEPGIEKRVIRKVGVVGAGTMGRGIVMNFLSAGIPATLVETKQDVLDGCVEAIRATYVSAVKKGRINEAQLAASLDCLSTSSSLDDLADCDLIIEAIFEDMAIKKQIFSTLDGLARQGAILATNTSTLDVNEIAQATQRPADVVGMHFFSPANIMKLLEVVRGDATADDVIVTVMDLAKRINKAAVVSGVCYGFIGNRILHKRQEQALALVNEGATPEQVDKVLYDFGLPMGPFAMWDLAGLDINYRIRQELRKSHPDSAPARAWTEDLVEAGRYGQKNGHGIYDYESGQRGGKPSPVTAAAIEAFRSAHNIEVRDIDDTEILERCLYAMLNEGAKILEEGIAQRALDIDVVWIYGYGFPKYRGGIMHWADEVGLATIYQRVCEFYQKHQTADWAPSKLLKQLAEEGGTFAGWKR
jgi:3-hydroxyacyl-CoA dehydrogenase